MGLLISVGIAALIAIPIIVAKFMTGIEAKAEPIHMESTAKEPTTAVLSEAEIIAELTAKAEKPTFADVYAYSFVEKADEEPETEPQAELETSAPSEPETSSFQPYASVPFDADFQEAIYKLCEKYEINFELILAVIKTESRFHTDSVGDNGASYGLMQIQPKWWQKLADERQLNIYEPIDNVEIGIILLTEFMKANEGDLNKALKQYNSGNPNNPSNAYVERVFANYPDV